MIPRPFLVEDPVIRKGGGAIALVVSRLFKLHEVYVAVSGPYLCSSSVGFRSSAPPFPRPPLPPFAPLPLVSFAPSRPQRPFASRHRLPPIPLAPLFWLYASPRFPLHSPLSARLFLRAILYALRPCRINRSPRKGMPTTNLVNPHFVCVSDAHARSRKGSVSAPPPRMTRVSVRPQRVTRASPCRPFSPSPFRPTASRQRPP